MLGTLMKYEIKAVARLLLPLYGAWIIVAFLLGLSLRSDGISSNSNVVITLTGLLYAFFTAAAVVVTAFILIQRFYKNLLGNEGYLMFALPVSTGKHLTNKIVSGAMWAFIGVVAAIVTGIAIIIAIEGVGSFVDDAIFLLKDFLLIVERAPSALLICLQLLVFAVLGCAQLAAEIYAAIAVGHQWSNHRVLGAILAYIAFQTVEGVLGRIALSIHDFVWDKGGLDFFNNLSAMAQTHITLLILILVVAAVLAIYWFISWKLLDSRLNLE